jgi:hypothetical protein
MCIGSAGFRAVEKNLTGGKNMLDKVRGLLEKYLPFLFDDDLQFKVRDIARLLGDFLVWPVNYVKSFFK